MKYILLLFCCVLFCGCSSKESKEAVETWGMRNGKLKVLSTTAMIDDLVGQVGGERIDHLALITGEIDPHSYELVKGDDEKLLLAQLIFYNGLGLEHGASLRYQIEHHPHAVSLGGYILQKYPQSILHVGKETDPHLWLDIQLWSKGVDAIVSGLSQLDHEGSAFYAENGKALCQRMEEEHRAIYSNMQNVSPEKRYLVTSHDAFNYFARAYLATPEEQNREGWRNRVEAPEGLAPEGQLSAVDIQKIVEHLLKHHIQVVFPESNVSRDSLKKIIHACRQKGLKVTISPEALYADAMGGKGSGADTYLTMVRHDANVMIKAWEEKDDK